MTQPDDRDVALFPRPRSLARCGEGVPAQSPARRTLDLSLDPEGFVLDTSGGTGAIVIRYGGPAGLRYAEATLAQLRIQSGSTLPGLVIEDSPDFRVRGYLLDVSRDRVPTRPTLERLVQLMALARVNHFELYLEHAFAYSGQEAVWQDASPLNADDVRWLDALCRDAGIELVPNQSCFGHMERWLAHPDHAWRGEAPEGLELMPGVRMPPALLAPTPANAEFALGLFDELLPLFTSKTVNINCDEPFELGKGASAAEVAADGRAKVYLTHVSRIAGPLIDKGYRVLFWADVLGQDVEALKLLPDGMVPVAWCYEAPGATQLLSGVAPELLAVVESLGIDLSGHDGFAEATAALAEAGRPFWVAPGTSTWTSLLGRIDNARSNLLDAAEVGRARGAEGYLITDWGDQGHLQPPSVSFGPLLFGGAVSWCADTNQHLDMATVLDRHAFLDRTGKLGQAVVDLGLLWAMTGQHQLNGSPLQTALVPGSFALLIGDPDVELLQELLSRWGAAVAAVEASAPACVDAKQVKHELLTAAGLARQGALRLLERAGVTPEVDLRADLARLLQEQRAAWLARAMPGGLADSLRRLEPLMDSNA